MAAAPPALRLIEGGGRVPLGPALELAALGTALTLTVALLARLPSWFHALGTFQLLYGAAFAFFACALLRIRRYAALPRAGLAVFAVALATRALLAPLPPSLSGDLYRYAWEGRVLMAGENPYARSPDDPALAHLRDREVWPAVNHKELSTIYPPLAEAGYALVAAVSPSVLAFKLWVTLHDLALVLVLMRALAAAGTSPVYAIAYAWNPLVLVEYAGTGHNDPTAMVWLALAFLWRRSRPDASALALVAGVLTKLAPLAALPFLFREWTGRARIVAGVLLAAGLGFFYVQTRHAYSGLAAYWGTWRNNELLFLVLERASGSFGVARMVALLAVAGVAWWGWRIRAGAEPAARATLGASLLTSPVLHPWYLGWPLALAPERLSPFWITLSLTAVLNYGVLRTPSEGRSFHLPLEIRWIEYGVAAAVALAFTLARRRAKAAV